MNLIHSLHLHFDMQNEAFAQDLYARWDSFFATYVEHIADEVLTQYSIEGEDTEISRLELDVGSILEEELDEQFPLRFREKLEEALIQCLRKTADSQQEIKRTSQKESAFQLLCHFLLHGSLSWTASGENRDIQKLFNKIVQENSKELKHFLQTYGHYTSLQQRLVYQLTDPGLEKGIHLLSPDSGGFIISYVHLLRTKYQVVEQPETTESNYRNTVWTVVYAYLLTHRSSYFDKKSFITQTILQLANKYNSSYDSLLSAITAELDTFRKKMAIHLELFHILNALKKELSEKRLKESLVDAAKFYKTVYRSLKKELNQQLSENSRKGLIHILSNPSSCRQFLQQLSEAEIMRLLPVVIPQESRFVIEVAQSLEKQKEQGALQGKTGGELRLLKWQVIFPLLLDKRGTIFNRKQFTRTVLQQITAHYNVEIRLLLEYFKLNAKSLFKIDKELKAIFAELIEEFTSASSVDVKEKSNTWETLLSLLVPSPTLSPILNPHQIKHIRQKLSDSSFRRKMIDCTREQERYNLVRLIYSKEQEFIIFYAKTLDKVHEYNLFKLRVANDFVDVKWRFLFTVLCQMPEDNFNRLYFVNRVLQQTAAHYNLNYFDLLLYFRHEKIVIYLPFHLDQLVEKLYQEEQEHWLKMALNNNAETDKYAYIDCISGSHTTFIKTYLKIVDQYHNKGLLQGKMGNNFKELKWCFVFTVLLATQHVVFNKKQFVLQTLTKMAAHYHLSVDELIGWFNTSFNKLVDSQFKEIANIIHELYQEHQQSNGSKTDQSADNPYLLNEALMQTFDVVTSEEKKLMNQLAHQVDFIVYIKQYLKSFSEIEKYIRKEFNRTIGHKQLLELLIRLSSQYKSLSQVEIISRILDDWKKTLNLSPIQEEKWKRKLEDTAKSNHLLNEYILHTQQIEEQKHIEKGQDTTREKENIDNNPIYIHNAGMLLVAPYFPQLFSMLGLIDDGKWKDRDAQIRAIYLLQYMVFEQTNYPEYEITLNKLLIGCKTETPIPRNIELTDKEKEAINSLLQAVLQYWEKLKNTSVTGFREGFLQREGKLEQKEDHYLITVEEKSYDMLIDTLPWNLGIVKFPWMKKRIEVRWR